MLAGRQPNAGSMKMVRDGTDEPRSRRPIFNTTFRAAASWLFFRVARSTRPAPFLRWRLRIRISCRHNIILSAGRGAERPGPHPGEFCLLSTTIVCENLPDELSNWH
jgi:hypothetical protein